MSLSEKAAYLKGLYDGMELDAAGSREAKLLSAVIDVLQEVAAHVTENEESIAALADQVDDVTELAEALRGSLPDEEDSEAFRDGFYEEDGEDAEFPEDDELQTSFEVECPNCERILTIGEEELSRGQIECPTCGQSFQIELSFEDDPSDGEEVPF